MRYLAVGFIVGFVCVGIGAFIGRHGAPSCYITNSEWTASQSFSLPITMEKTQ